MMTKVNQLEYKILQMLKEDSRKTASEIAKELNLSRATVAKIIKSLKEKGVKFTVDYYEDGQFTAFVISDKCLEGEECYKLIDGRFMNVIRGDLKGVSEKISQLNSTTYFVAIDREDVKKIEKAELYCDYCGSEIKGSPYLVKWGKKIYYTCCKTCQIQLRKRLEKTMNT